MTAIKIGHPDEFTPTQVLAGPDDEALVVEIAIRMSMHGWQGQPIWVFDLLDGTKLLVDGHHRVEAARRAGIQVLYQELSDSEYLTFVNRG